MAVYRARLHAGQYCAVCRRWLPAGSVVWYDSECGCAYCGAECRRQAGK